tara:strand:+ start:25895 stop:26077 length:183 start_codon:yes stop_codon:yes gene_type:complete
MYNNKNNLTTLSFSYLMSLRSLFESILTISPNSIKNGAQAVSGPIDAVHIGHFKYVEEWP